MKTGTKVGARRWAYSHAHPDCWYKPWHGFVLAQDDPRAWEKTLAFPGRRPSDWEARDHVAWCHAEGLLDTVVPVLWHFEGEEKVVHWERLEILVTYRNDLAAWRSERAGAYLRTNQGELRIAK